MFFVLYHATSQLGTLKLVVPESYRENKSISVAYIQNRNYSMKGSVAQWLTSRVLGPACFGLHPTPSLTPVCVLGQVT